MEHVFAQGIMVIGSAVAVLGLSGKIKRICGERLCRGI